MYRTLQPPKIDIRRSIVDYIPWIVGLHQSILGVVEDYNFDTLRQEFAEQLKFARKRSVLSQEALALAADVDRTYVSQLERGVANPSLLILHRLASVLSCRLVVSVLSSSKTE